MLNGVDGDPALQRAPIDAGYGDIVAAARSIPVSSSASIRSIAARGVATAHAPLPHLDQVQRSFGRHDVSHVRAAVGGAGGAAANEIGAHGYAMGNAVAFREPPDLHLAAHEAAHVVQQRAGVQLAGGVGQPHDAYERAADAVADAVVAGRSAEPLLDRMAPTTPTARQPAADPVQRQPFGAHTQHPFSTFPKQPAPACDPAAQRALDHEVVELQGTATFNPSQDLRRAIACYAPGPVTVHVKFGKLAHGDLRILVKPSAQPSMGVPGAPAPVDYDTDGVLQMIELTHPLLPGSSPLFQPRARIWIKNSVVHGVVAFVRDPDISMRPGTWNDLYNDHLTQMFGWGDPFKILEGTLVNSIENGVLSYGFSPFKFELPPGVDLDGSVVGSTEPGLRGTGTYIVTDDRDAFTATANIEGAGIASGTMPIHKRGAQLTGAGSYALKLAPVDAFGGKFSGSIEGAFGNGHLLLTGRATYAGRRAKGDVTVMLAPRAVAWRHVQARTAAAAGVGPTAASAKSAYAIVGWGDILFPVNDWLEGNVSAVVDPDGFITAVAALRTTKELTFLDGDKYSGEKTLLHKTGSIPVLNYLFASIDVGYDATVTARGRFGPLTVYDVVVTGTFSSRTGGVVNAAASGRVRLDAAASIDGTLGGSVALTFAHVADAAKIELNGHVSAKAQAEVELAPKFELLPPPTSGGASQPRFRISGALSAKAAASLGLSGSLTFHRMIFFIPDVNLGDYEWPIGELDLEKQFSYELGAASEAPSVDVQAKGVSEDGFKTLMSALSSRGRPGAAENTGRHDRQGMAQDAATAVDDPRQQPRPTAVSVPFVMNHQPHTLSVVHTPNATIRMDSADPGPLDDKLTAEVETTIEHERLAPGDIELKEKEKAAHNLLTETRATEHALDAAKSEIQAVSEPNLAELASGVATFGDTYGEPNLGAKVTAPDRADPSEPAVEIEIVKGRYVIENEAQLKAVRRHFASLVLTPPADAGDPMLAKYWARWKDQYFPERIAEIQKALGANPSAAPTKAVKKKKSGATKIKKIQGPQTWDAYADGQATFDEIRAAKDFQPELRSIILDRYAQEGTPIDASKAEIDVGLRATRRGVPKTTNFADLVLPGKPSTNPADPPTLEVYSLKVRNVKRQLDKDPKDSARVTAWIGDRLRDDIHEAAQKYGYEVEYRRPRVSTPDGRASSSGPRNPNYETKFRVSLVHLVWKNDPAIIPDRLRQTIMTMGARASIEERSSSKTKVDFALEPQ